MLSQKQEIMPSLNLPLWLIVFLIWGFDDLGKTNVLACNTYGDYCDSLDEHPIDTNSATTSDATEILPEDTPYFVNHYTWFQTNHLEKRSKVNFEYLYHLYGFGDTCILLLENHVFACISTVSVKKLAIFLLKTIAIWPTDQI